MVLPFTLWGGFYVFLFSGIHALNSAVEEEEEELILPEDEVFMETSNLPEEEE